MSEKIKIGNLADAIESELTVYSRDIAAEMDSAAESAAKKLVKLTRQTAPKGARRSFYKSISSKLLRKNVNGSTYVWFVKAPNHRLTHLLVYGHATRDGGRTKGDPFLQNAVDVVLPEFEKIVKEALK